MNRHKNAMLSVKGKRIVSYLYLITGVLTLLHVAILCVYFWINDEDKFDFVRLIDMDYEGNVPTLFSAFLFIFAAVLLMLISSQAEDKESAFKGWRGEKFKWAGIALVFIFLGVDEGTKMHEYVGDWVEQFINAQGFLYFPWVLPYMLIFTFLVFVYLPFYFRLPSKTRKEFFIAAALFLTGAVVFEVFSAREADLHGTATILYSVLYTIEEVLEMVGLIVFIDSLFSYMRMRKIQIVFN